MTHKPTLRKPKPYGMQEAMALTCRLTSKWGLYVHIPSFDWWEELSTDEFIEQMRGAIPYLFEGDHLRDLNISSGVIGESLFFLFDTQEEMEHHYWLTIGDDGPNKSNPYNGKVRVYALTCDNRGRFRNENT